MRIALIGARGQLGTDLLPLLGNEAIGLGHEELEITDSRSVDETLAKLQPDCVINAAAYNLVDRAEDEPELAYAVNALGPRNLAKFCGEHRLRLLHVSTDYVFSGRCWESGGQQVQPYTEADAPDPLSAYGVSKLTGEYYVRNLCPRHFIVRTCGLYGHAGARGKGNFVETMLRLGAEREELRVVNDQVCTPTATVDLARAIAALVRTEAFGLYHATNTGSTTWYDLAREIFRLTGSNVQVTPITSEQFGAIARRPSYSVLSHEKLQGAIGFTLPAWQDALAQYLATRP